MMIGVDVGGTFTDVVVVAAGKIGTIKVQTGAQSTEDQVIEGARRAGVADAAVFNHASTHGLNAVITRQLPKIAFLATEGHRDILDRGRVWRPAAALTDPHWRRSFGDAARPLIPRYLRRGVRERVTVGGDTLIPLDENELIAQLAVLRKCEVEGVAICLLNSYLYPAHEQRVRDLVQQELGPIACSISSEVSPLAREYPRAVTTVIDVCMRLIYGGYTTRLSQGLRDLGFKGALNYADCAAKLLPVAAALSQPYKIVFAGPAAGTVASRHFGESIGAPNLLCADVGGTSCDISLITGGQPYINTMFELEHDLTVNALSVEISSIGAGGGSLITIDGAGAVQVGPGSAGADPGPACYGKGGRLPTMTDACLLMGIIDPNAFAAGQLKLDSSLSRAAFMDLDTSIPYERRVSYSFRTGINNIAEGLSDIAVAHGVDPRDYSLMAFGAAGPMLLPAVLGLVNVAEVIVPPHPGLFSALGLVSSDQVYGDSRTAYTILSADCADSIDRIYNDMETRLRNELPGDPARIRFRRVFDGQLLGQTWDTPFVPVPDGAIDASAIDAMIASFHDTYQTRWGNRFTHIPVQGVTYRIEATILADKVEYPKAAGRTTGTLRPGPQIEISFLEDRPVNALEYQREDLRAHDRIEGPAIVREPLSTTFVLPGQFLIVGDYGELRIRRSP
jgi:N-methylhydantoinase A